MDESSEEARDRGLQRERTALSWERTGIACIAAGGLYLRAVPSSFHPIASVPGVSMIVIGAYVALRAARPFRRRLDVVRHHDSVMGHPLVPAVGIATVAFCVASLLLVLNGM